MKIGIVGWYGTDTLGDRAILDGIIEIFKNIEAESTVLLGSLFPFYTQRSLYEDKEALSLTAPKFKIFPFDMKDNKALKTAVAQMDVILMGGGPLMDIEELFLVEKCFDYAQKHNIPRIIMGCGIGPLENETYRISVGNILKNSTSVFLRDRLSLDNMEHYFGSTFNAIHLGDPAIVSIEKYIREERGNGEYVVINVRDYPKEAYSATSIVSDEHFVQMIADVSKRYSKVKLVPMHSFFVGGDDREYLTKLKFMLENSENVEVINKPMNIAELYEVFTNAKACIAMRYHAVVMQTILNGNNIVLNYTNEKNGKISGFINLLGVDFYSDRMINLQTISKWDIADKLELLDTSNRFNYKKSEMKQNYVAAVKDALGR